MNNKDFFYSGSELTLFSEATTWKSYFSRLMKPYLGEKVLEVGAGIGSTTRYLCQPPVYEWMALEPDEASHQVINGKIASGELPNFCTSCLGTLADIPENSKFNSILYVDVLEHIDDDLGEVERASQFLLDGGFLIVLVPAHPWLYTSFDESIGHYRRYTKKSLLSITPHQLRCDDIRYLDSVGLLASLANRFWLKTSQPTVRQIAFWDRYMVNISRIFDRLTFYSMGKSALIVWQKLDA